MSRASDALRKLAALNSKVQLRSHQEDAVQYVVEGDGSALLAHGTGSGKTLSGIAAFEKLRDLGKAKRALVLTPASLQENFAQDGVKKFTDSSVSRGPDGKSTYQIMSYAKFRRDPERYVQESKADTVIADEIHRAKDKQSATHKALSTAAQVVDNFIGLTGSPISNHPREIVPLMDLVSPEHELGSSQAFQKRHTKKEVYDKGGFLRGPKARTELKRRPELGGKVKGRIHYLGHEDLTQDMPGMDIKEVHVEMTPEQTKLYNFSLGKLTPNQRRLIRDGLPASQSEAQHILSAIMKARQASNSVGTHKDIPLDQAAEETPKLKQVMDDVQEHLRNTSDGQAVVYTNLVHGGADALYAGLKKRGLQPGLFAGVGALGKVTKENRQQAVEDFRSGKKNVILLTPAAGEGVSLNNATFFAEVDRHYNPERNQQAIARGRRLGGLSHRPKKDRTLEVRRYYSKPKPNWYRKMLGQSELGVDSWIQTVADEKNRLNKDFREVVKTASKKEPPLSKEEAKRQRNIELLRWITDPDPKVQTQTLEDYQEGLSKIRPGINKTSALTKMSEIQPSSIGENTPITHDIENLYSNMKAGDVFLTKANKENMDPFSWISKTFFKKPWMHAGIYAGDGNVVHTTFPLSRGASGKVTGTEVGWGLQNVREQTFKDYQHDKKDILVLRPKDSTHGARAIERMRSLTDKTPYSFGDVARTLWRGTFNRGDDKAFTSHKPLAAMSNATAGWAFDKLDFRHNRRHLRAEDFLDHPGFDEVLSYSQDIPEAQEAVVPALQPKTASDSSPFWGWAKNNYEHRKTANTLLQVAMAHQLSPHTSQAIGNMTSHMPVNNQMMAGRALADQVTGALDGMSSGTRSMIMQRIMQGANRMAEMPSLDFGSMSGSMQQGFGNGMPPMPGIKYAGVEKVAVTLDELRTAYDANKEKFPPVRRSLNTADQSIGKAKDITRSLYPQGNKTVTFTPDARPLPAFSVRPVSSDERSRTLGAIEKHHGYSSALKTEEVMDRVPKVKSPMVFQEGDFSTIARKGSPHRGVPGFQTPITEPASREAINRSLYLHEVNEARPHRGVFQFKSHNSLDPMLQDLNIASTLRGDGTELEEAQKALRELRKGEVNALSWKVPEVDRLNLGKERVSRHARKRLQELYDKRMMESIGKDGSPFSQAGTQGIPRDLQAYDKMHREMYPPTRVERGMEHARRGAGYVGEQAKKGVEYIGSKGKPAWDWLKKVPSVLMKKAEVENSHNKQASWWLGLLPWGLNYTGNTMRESTNPRMERFYDQGITGRGGAKRSMLEGISGKRTHPTVQGMFDSSPLSQIFDPLATSESMGGNLRELLRSLPEEARGPVLEQIQQGVTAVPTHSIPSEYRPFSRVLSNTPADVLLEHAQKEPSKIRQALTPKSKAGQIASKLTGNLAGGAIHMGTGGKSLDQFDPSGFTGATTADAFGGVSKQVGRDFVDKVVSGDPMVGKSGVGGAAVKGVIEGSLEAKPGTSLFAKHTGRFLPPAIRSGVEQAKSLSHPAEQGAAYVLDNMAHGVQEGGVEVGRRGGAAVDHAVYNPAPVAKNIGEELGRQHGTHLSEQAVRGAVDSMQPKTRVQRVVHRIGKALGKWRMH